MPAAFSSCPLKKLSSEAMRRLDWTKISDQQRWKELQRPAQRHDGSLRETVRSILGAVRELGDEALRRFSREFDSVELKDFTVSRENLALSWRSLPERTRDALMQAKDNISRFHARQYPTRLEMETMRGVRCFREWRPLETVGFYVPGGTAPLLSTVLMLGLPSLVAGNQRRILCSPPGADGLPHPLIRAAAYLCEIHEVFSVGGAQAIGAMAFGTESLPKVDKIFGPGNAWVTEAKSQVSSLGTAIDMPAGPSEIMIIADASAVPAFVAADLLSQAEHDVDSQALLISCSPSLSEEVLAELDRQLPEIPRRAIAEKVLKNSAVIDVPDLECALSIANAYAPEHLMLQTRSPKSLLPKIQHAGSVFIGPWSPESAGDYASGTNHVLPTYGFARQMGSVTVESFMKPMSFQEISRDGLERLAPTLEELARVEGLEAHRRAVAIRLNHREWLGAES